MSNSIKVAIIYSHLPHYRVPVFQKLLESKSINYSIFYSENIIDRSIKSDDSLSQSLILPIYKIGPIFFQTGLGRSILSNEFSVYIFLGNPYSISTWIYTFIIKIKGGKVLFWTHGWLKNERGFIAWVRHFFYKLSDGLLLYGNRAKNIGLKKNMPVSKLHVIYNSLDYATQRDVRGQLVGKETNPLDQLYFLSIARLTKELRLTLAIEALCILAEKTGIKHPLVIIGDGPERKNLEDLALAKGVQLIFLGALYDENIIGKWIFNARAVISPGKVGLTAMHSLAYGVPVISHDKFDAQMPEYEAILPGVSGDFFEFNSAESLAEVLAVWVDKPRSSEERRDSISIIEKSYTPETQAKILNEILVNMRME